MRVIIYVEGGGDNNNVLRTQCRQGFTLFFEKTGLKGGMPRIVACGSRQQAYDDFRLAVSKAGQDELPLLLVDAETPLSKTVWEHVADHRWERPGSARDEHLYLMVQCMEAWFLADRETLSAYYGQGFREGALPRNPRIEEIPKQSIFDGLDKATRNTQKGKYDKGRHSFAILGKIDPEKVCRASVSAHRLVEKLKELLKDNQLRG